MLERLLSVVVLGGALLITYGMAVLKEYLAM